MFICKADLNNKIPKNIICKPNDEKNNKESICEPSLNPVIGLEIAIEKKKRKRLKSADKESNFVKKDKKFFSNIVSNILWSTVNSIAVFLNQLVFF